MTGRAVYSFNFACEEFDDNTPMAVLNIRAENAAEAWALFLVRAHKDFPDWTISHVLITFINPY